MKYNFSKLSERQKRIVGALLTIGSAIGLFYIVHSDRNLFGTKLRELETATSEFLMQTLPLQDTVFTPPPLRETTENQKSFLSTSGILEATNAERALQGAQILTENSALDAIAQKKLADMFFYQYFDHVSPLGIGAGELAKRNGYDYIFIGENLAMGNFTDDRALVTAWMESPGHRENILNDRYTEIGIAVGQGIYEGKVTWIAVQEFGRPLSECVVPSETQKKLLDTARENIEQEERLIFEKREQIDALPTKYGAEYEALVDEYNVLVRAYNAHVLDLKNQISAYNEQVTIFNTCASGK